MGRCLRLYKEGRQEKHNILLGARVAAKAHPDAQRNFESVLYYKRSDLYYVQKEKRLFQVSLFPDDRSTESEHL